MKPPPSPEVNSQFSKALPTLNQPLHWEMLLLLIYLVLCSGSASLSIRAADMSALGVLDCWGACNKFRSSLSSEPEDALLILARSGFNTVRLRVWVNPLANHSEGSLTSVVAMSRRAAAAGLSVWIDFHLSDWWADPAHQTKPAAWLGLSFSELILAVQSHVYEVLTAVKGSGASVRVVQVGNEISPGCLWPQAGEPCANSGSVTESCVSNWPALGALVGAGLAVSRERCPGALLAIHTDLGNRGERAAEAAEFFYSRLDAVLPGGPSQYDAIALSYYLQWNASGPAYEGRLASALQAAFPSKELLIAETNYAWAGGHPAGVWPASEEGQLEFWRATLGNASDWTGVSWWGGEYAGNFESALFDAQYVALPALLQGFTPPFSNS